MTSTKSQLERVQLTDTQIKVIMPENVLHQIQFLCRKIAKVEWSGILFYSIEGSIKDPENMVITLKDILPMHKGTSAYTEYSFDERVIDHMMANEELEDCKMGHIHSHNTMGVFFSGTDWSELEDNAPNHNFYLSLIVNNFMDFCAKVCFIAETSERKQFNFEAKDENGEKWIYASEDYLVDTKKLVVYDCAIESPSNEIITTETFKEKVDEIIAKAERATPPATFVSTGGHLAGAGAGFNSQNASQGKSWSRSSNDSVLDKEPTWRNTPDFDFNSRHKPQNMASAITNMFFSEIAYDEVIDNFSMFVLNTGNSVDAFADIEDVVDFYKKRNVTGSGLGKNVLGKYVEVYEKYFADLDVKNDEKVFHDITESVIAQLQHEADTSTMDGLDTMLLPTIQGLTRMLVELEQMEQK